MAINKVVFGNDTLIDITDTTALASDVSIGKYFYLANGEKVQGTAVLGGMTVVETVDQYGGTIVDISGDPVKLQAKTATPSSTSQTIGPDDTYTGLSEVVVEAIPSQYIIPAGSTNITSNGTVDVTAYASAIVNVQPVIDLQNKSVSPSTSAFDVTYDSGYSGLGTVSIAAMPTAAAATPTVSINSSTGVVTATSTQSAGYVSAGTTSVTLSLSTQSGTTISPTESIQTAVSSGKYTTGDVKIGAISSDYVGSNITARTSSDLGASGATVTVPSGYYASAAEKSVATATAATPSVSINTTTGVVTATSTQSAGYVSAGTTSSTLSLTTQSGSTISPTESVQTAVAAGKYTLGDVKIGAISSNYVGSNIATHSSADLAASGSTITAPAGYYAAAAAKSISAGSATTPATTISVTPGISVNTSTGVITATASASQYVTPTVSAGYVSAGTSGRITVSGSNTSSLTTQAAKTVTPTKSSQTAVAANRYTTGAVTVAAIPAAYQDVTGVTASAADVLSGKTIVNSSGTTVNGSLVIQHYYTGSGTPAAATGSNGDIYLKTS